MDLDWITLYDYMTIHSQTELKEKINKFYESFYPLKLKQNKHRKLDFAQIERGGLLGIIATYIIRVLSVLTLYLEAEYLLAQGKTKELIKLARMFIEIEGENLAAALRLEKTVYIIQEAYYFYVDKREEKKSNKSFFELKILCSLKRMFEFYYNLEELKVYLDKEGYMKMNSIIRLNSVEAFEKSKPHFKLFPEIREIMIEILKFFASDEKVPFNFHSHLTEENKKGAKKSFEKVVKQLFTIMPNKQKELFLNLTDQNFVEFLAKSKFPIPKELAENYFRSEQQINAIIAEEENFLESILVSESYRGRPEWKKSVVEQMVNLSSENRKGETDIILESKRFKFSEDFPLH